LNVLCAETVEVHRHCVTVDAMGNSLTSRVQLVESSASYNQASGVQLEARLLSTNDRLTALTIITSTSALNAVDCGMCTAAYGRMLI